MSDEIPLPPVMPFTDRERIDRGFPTKEEERQLMAWLRTHGVDPGLVPLAATFTYTADGLWHVPMYKLNDRGKKFIDKDTGEPAMTATSFRQLEPFPLGEGR